MAATPDYFLDLAAVPPDSPSVFLDLPPTPHHQDSSPEDLVLPYISRILMEEDVDDKFFYQYPDHPALLQAQQPFLDIISTSTSTSDSTTITNNSSTLSSSPSSGAAEAAADTTTTWPYDPIELSQLQSPHYPFNVNPDMLASAFLDGTEEADAKPALSSGDGSNSDKPTSAFLKGGDEANEFLPGEDTAAEMLNSAFLKGMEEANKLLPSNDRLAIKLEASTEELSKVSGDSNKFLPSDSKVVVAFAGADVKDEMVVQGGSGRGRKNAYDAEELEVQGGRSSKQTALQADDVGARELINRVMVAEREMCIRGIQELRVAMQKDAATNHGKGNGKAARGRRGASKVVDLRTLLIHCAQAVAIDDRRTAGEVLKQIRQHASTTGDATQRLAHCFADGLQARLAGTGSEVYRAIVAKRTSAVDFLNAYMLYTAAACFMKVTFMFSNMSIYNAVAGRSKVHIVDYTVHYGFQWPSLLRRLADREGGPPEVRITGIDLPQPGFRPAEQIEETGRRLSDFAREVGVPFKFHAIAAKFETVSIEDLNIDPDEVLVVNSLCHFGNLMDESVVADSPRDAVLNNIRKMRPDVFVHAIINGSYSAPFFVTRFREALFHFSATFDMLEATVPRDNDQRLLMERDILGRCALNVIACEGAERVERPETYKQWQARSHRAGLRQLPLNRELVRMSKDKVKRCYHKDFIVDEDNRWLLQGWKGRILYALSTWVADDATSQI